MMSTGRRKTPRRITRSRRGGRQGAEPESGALPGNIVITPGGAADAARTPRISARSYAEVVLGNGAPPQYSQRPDSLVEARRSCANDLRQKINERFARTPADRADGGLHAVL